MKRERGKNLLMMLLLLLVGGGGALAAQWLLRLFDSWLDMKVIERQIEQESYEDRRTGPDKIRDWFKFTLDIAGEDQEPWIFSRTAMWAAFAAGVIVTLLLLVALRFLRVI